MFFINAMDTMAKHSPPHHTYVILECTQKRRMILFYEFLKSERRTVMRLDKIPNLQYVLCVCHLHESAQATNSCEAEYTIFTSHMSLL